MSICIECKRAQWARTKSGALDPSGAGWCVKADPIPPAPAAFQLFPEPQLLGWNISRKSGLPANCRYFDKKGATSEPG